VPRYREGEIVAVDDRGWTYRLNEQSTGASRADIHNFTAELKDKALPGMGEARAAQIAEANRHRQTEPWHQRDASRVEMKISGIQEAADRGGMPVAAGLQAEGLTLARVDAAGRANVEHENRRQYENARREGKTDVRMRQAPKEGELVAVNRYGDVFRLNPRFVETDRLERDATGGRDKTPTLSQAQQHFATARQQQRDDRAAARATIDEGRQTQRDRAEFVHDLKQGFRGATKGADIHAAPEGGDSRNIHAHIQVTLRPLEADGKLGKKWRVSIKGGYASQLKSWRTSWANLTNRHLARHGHAVKIDERTLKAQGVDRDAGKHMGREATWIERKGNVSLRGTLNRIKARKSGTVGGSTGGGSSGDGSGGGAGQAASAFKFAAPETVKHNAAPMTEKPVAHSGAERRRRNVWVATEKRGLKKPPTFPPPKP
jgi:hypothetical protein